MLTVIDDKWKEHLREMDDLKEGINFRAYGQKDPLIEYKIDGFELFVQMLEDIHGCNKLYVQIYYTGTES